MILENHIRGRRRILDEAKKARLCELVALESYTIESAAESLDVSLRTVQRERRADQDFDHELRLALQQPPDPRKLMEQAARTHWRAAAWLLERTQPEEFARKPVNTTSLKLAATAFRYIQEAALGAVPEECREALYRQTQAAIERSTDCCFPMRGPWGDPRVKRLPFETPLADVEWRKGWDDEVVGVLHDRDDQGNVLTPPADPMEVAARQSREAALAAKRVELRWRLAELFRVPSLDGQSAEGVLSPEIAETTKSDATKQHDATKSDPTNTHPGFAEFIVDVVAKKIDDECPEVWNDCDELHHPDVQEPRIQLQLLSERLQRHRRRERRAQRAAEKKAKAAKKRAAQSRRAA